MYLSIICLLCAFAYGISRISGPNFKAINFAEKIKGQKLKRSLIRDGEVDSDNNHDRILPAVGVRGKRLDEQKQLGFREKKFK